MSRYETQLTYSNNTAQLDLGFPVVQIAIFNFTNANLYITRGNDLIPSNSAYDYKCLPNSTLNIPTSGYLFGLNLVFDSIPSDLQQKCIVIFLSQISLGQSNVGQHYEESLTCSRNNVPVNLPFVSQAILILNYSDGNLYISRGNDYISDNSNWDYMVEPNTVLIIPVSSIDFYLSLQNCTTSKCVVIFSSVNQMGYVNYGSEFNCNECPDIWQYEADFKAGLHGFNVVLGTFESGVGIKINTAISNGAITYPSPDFTLTKVIFKVKDLLVTGTRYANITGTISTSVQTTFSTFFVYWTSLEPVDISAFSFLVNYSGGVQGGSIPVIEYGYFEGIGENPFT